MLKNNYLITRPILAIIVFIAIFLFSCKTQQNNTKSADEQKNNTVLIDKYKNPQEEEKPKAVTPESINEQKVNEFAEKKEGLLCSLKQLKTELENTSDENQKIKINNQIEQLKNQIAEFDKVIETTFPEEENIDEIDKYVQYLIKDC